MLELKDIKKEYELTEGVAVHALKGINLEFRQSEFVSILGPSGCGKTTMLNIIGGLDQYTTGDLLIEGKSTKDYKDKEWDAYRNQTIGIVFQSYNLISHLSVLENVEIALTLSGISIKERTERAKKVLEEVGLADQLKKRPNQLSGGQMQRVAIARAMVNNPKILLADEPTGALDSITSVQIMDLMKKISKERLVIMVTHNAELAQAYSNRIIQLSDGLVVSDSVPYKTPNEKKGKKEKLVNQKTSMSFFTALRHSFKNLLTKKVRTIITVIAGSIGIIGVALVMAVSAGMTRYIDTMQRDILAGYPITISSTIRVNESENTNPKEFPTDGKFLPYTPGFGPMGGTPKDNNISEDYIEHVEGLDANLYNDITYSYGYQFNIINSAYAKVEYKEMSLFGETYFLNPLPQNRSFVESQYEVLKGSYPTGKNQIALIVDSYNRIDERLVTKFGLNINANTKIEDVLGTTFKVITNDLYYADNNPDLEALYNNADAAQSVPLEVVGVLRVLKTAKAELLDAGFVYTTAFADYMLEDEVYGAKYSTKAGTALDDYNIALAAYQADPTDITKKTEAETKCENALKIGAITTPNYIAIYPKDFKTKQQIKKYLDLYNKNLPAEEQVAYSDLAEMIANISGTLIDTITIVLAVFAGISLVVSSVMIGIITYVSVIERTKEIGILRAIGARKKDISRLFNAETVIIGFAAGVFGVLVSALLTLPINAIVGRFTDVSHLAYLPVLTAVILVAVSTTLTLIAGFVPSRIAAKKDPVVALRTE